MNNCMISHPVKPMSTALAIVFLGLVFGAGSMANAQNQPFGQPDSIERCRVIAQEMTDYNDNTRLVFEQFCEMLHASPPPAATALAPQTDNPPQMPTVDELDPSAYFVKCVVKNDPDWIGFRLVTRQQCDAMLGDEYRREQAFQSNKPPQNNQVKVRDFSPK